MSAAAVLVLAALFVGGDRGKAAVDLQQATGHHVYPSHSKPGADTNVDAVAPTSSGPHYTLQIQCSLATEGGNCYNPMTCNDHGALGHLYTVLADGRPVGQTCLTPAQEPAAQAPVLTPAMVLTAFRRLEWPSARLTLQPPDHRTLVNLPTVFSTDLTAPQTRTVTLVGLRVRIEATPVAYTWRPGDEPAWTTGDPGAAYRPGDDVGTLNTHTYLRPGRARAAVDVRYHGRYQVDGGPWIDIPQERVVVGPAETLTVLEARGFLTGS